MRAQSVNAICMCLRKQKRRVSRLFPFGSTVNCPKSKETVLQLHTLPTSNFCGSYLSKFILRTRTLLVRVFLHFSHSSTPTPPAPKPTKKNNIKILKSTKGLGCRVRSPPCPYSLPAPGHLGMVSMDNPST